MTIAEPTEPSKAAFWQPSGIGFTIGVLVLTASASFGLGMLAEKDMKISASNSVIQAGFLESSGANFSSNSGAGASNLSTSTNGGAPIPAGGQVVGSNSTRQYYLPWCPQVASISAGDAVTFDSQQTAEAKGFTAGKGCPGL
ncbi:hypothetical protein H0X32_01470 [Patescibacteria group bacterium]|nr:hypothetical protein [Patescibacteria group bacterium]